jgi:hypothetical protein
MGGTGGWWRDGQVSGDGSVVQTDAVTDGWVLSERVRVVSRNDCGWADWEMHGG